MEQRCHQFFGCKRDGCPMFNEEETGNCWEIAGTFNFCMNNNDQRISTIEKQEFCNNCLYFTYRKKMEVA